MLFCLFEMVITVLVSVILCNLVSLITLNIFGTKLFDGLLNYLNYCLFAHKYIMTNVNDSSPGMYHITPASFLKLGSSSPPLILIAWKSASSK